VDHLIDNAIDAMGQAISVRTSQSGDRIVVEIADDGPARRRSISLFEQFLPPKMWAKEPG